MGYYDDDDDDYSELFDAEELSEFVSRHGNSDGDEGEDDDEDDEKLLQSVHEQVGYMEKRENAGEFPSSIPSTDKVADDRGTSLRDAYKVADEQGTSLKDDYNLADVQGTNLSYDLFYVPGEEDADESQEAHGLDTNAQQLQYALEKNRECQGVLKEMLLKIEEKKKKNAEMQKLVKSLGKYEKQCERRIFNVNGSDAKLISTATSLSNAKPRGKRRTFIGPEKNKDVEPFLLLRKSVRLKFKEWSTKECEALRDAVKTQVQQHLFTQAMEAALQNEESGATLETLEEEISNISDIELKRHLHVVNWVTVAKTALPGRTSKECKAWWLNHEGLINSGPWSKAEDLQLLSLAQDYQFAEWEIVAERLGTNRTAAQCLVRYQRSLNANLWLKDWSPEDDELLRRTVEMCGEKDWETVAACMEGRTAPQVMQRWIQVLQQKRRGRWSVEEDLRLRMAVLICGAQQWKNIAAHVPGRTATQCRERWRDVLDPDLKHGAFSSEEDEKLEEAVKQFGEHRWSAVAEVMKPRTDNQCFRRWKALHPERRLQFRKEVEVKKYLPTFGKRAKERSTLEPADMMAMLEDESGNALPPAESQIARSREQRSIEEPQAIAPAKKPPRPRRGKRKAADAVHSVENEQAQEPGADVEKSPSSQRRKATTRVENGTRSKRGGTKRRKAQVENSDNGSAASKRGTKRRKAQVENSDNSLAQVENSDNGFAAAAAEANGSVGAQERPEYPSDLAAIDIGDPAMARAKQNRAARLAKLREKRQPTTSE